ncbi:MAG: YkgJ family cysteine cluster protein [Candidatus Rokubacteria bacterium]|nr:YkgJ family cysteine cluster protein [Candidatus Rokubacteria bacterium]
MQEHRDRKLLIPGDVVFTCQNSGACCRNDWLIGVDDPSAERLASVDWTALDPSLPPGEKFVKLPLPLAGGETLTFARKRDGACVFLGPGEKCGIHSTLGHAAKPQVCREFPYYFVDTPDGVAVGVSFACTAVRAHHGRSLGVQQDEIRDVLAGSSRVGAVPGSIVLYSGIDIGWEDYRVIEAALLDILGTPDRSLAHALIAGSVLVNLAVSLAQVAKQKPDTAAAARETIASAIGQLRDERYARLFDIAASVRYPRRPSHAHLAPLFAWLRLSRLQVSRVVLVASLYADYFRFRKNRGRVPDLVTGGEALDLASIAHVRLADDPESDAFLREYWSHVVWRKTLTPMHGVFRGYHTLLALHAFTRWVAKVRAYRSGRRIAGIADLKEAVRLVEQRFVLHSQFGNLFAISPILTILADRLFGQPSFVPLAVLDPPRA